MLLERFVAGKSIPRIADELGISHVAAYQHLLRHVPNEWKEHQGAKALAVLDKCEEDLEGATDNVTVSRAREYARLQMWKLERTLSNLYAPDNTTININQVIGDPGQVIQEISQLEERLGHVAEVVAHSMNIEVRPHTIQDT